MNKNTTLILLIILSSLDTLAQVPSKQWDYSYGGNNIENMSAMVRTTDGGSLVGGSSLSGISGDKTQDKWGSYDYWIIRLDSLGNKLWDKDFGGTKEEILTAIDTSDDGGFILGGYSWSSISGDKSQNKQGENDYWILKIDANGNKEWDKRFGGTSIEFLKCVRQTSDGGYILGGDSYSDIGGDVTQSSRGWYDYWVVKTDSNGVKQWDARFGGTTYDFLHSLLQTSDGGYLLAGASDSHTSIDKLMDSRGGSDYWIVKLDSGGSKQWDAVYGGDSIDYCNSIIPTNDGGYLLGGYSFSGISQYKSQENRGREDYWVVKIDATGLQEWDKTFGGTKSDILTSLTQLSDGGFLLAGHSDSPSSGEKTQPMVGFEETPYDYPDYWMVKIDQSGNYQWDKPFGGTFVDLCYAVLENTDHSFTLAGESESEAGGDKSEDNHGAAGNSDYWLVKTTVSGEANSVSIGNIFPDTYLQGNIFEIPFSASGAFNSQNTFYALLSDNSGSFDNPDTIGLLNSSEPGIILATIPDHLPNGENYHLRVIGSSPPVTSPATEEQITIGIYATSISDVTYGGDDIDRLSDILSISNGGWLLAGETYSTASGDVSQTSRGDIDFWILETDSSGVKQWDMRFGGDNNDEPTCILKTSDEGYLLAGYSNSDDNGDKTQNNRGSFDYWIVKTDANGVKQWDKRFGGAGWDRLYTAVQTDDGGYLLGGQSSSDAGYDKSEENIDGGMDYWVVKVDASGNKLWDKVYGGDSYDDLYVIAPDPAGGYLLLGESSSDIGYDVSAPKIGGDDFWLLKIDENGMKLWDRKYGGPGSETPTKILFASDGGYILSGITYSDVGGDVSEPNYGNSDMWILKLDGSFNKQWDKRFGGSSYEGSTTVIETLDYGYVIAGGSQSWISGNKTQNNWGLYSTDYWMIRLDSALNQLWDTRFGGFKNDAQTTMVETPSGNFLLGGWSESPTGGDKTQNNYGNVSSDIWLVTVAEADFTEAIFTNQLDTLIYASGDSLKIQFTATGSYSIGNIFTAQLSDATGSFSSSISIGTLTSIQSGIIDALIPASTVPGTQYRIRVVSSNPSVAGTNNGEDITISPGDCAAPADFYTNAIKATSAIIHWSPVTVANQYKIAYRQSGTLVWAKAASSNAFKKLKNLQPSTNYDWRVKSDCGDLGLGSSGWSTMQHFYTLPARLDEELAFSFFEVFPNPASSITTISFSLEENSPVFIELFTIDGKSVLNVADEYFGGGEHQLQMNTDGISPGMYLLKLTTPAGSFTRKMAVE